MNSQIKKILLISGCCLITVPLIVYIINFWDTDFSNNSKDWANFGSYMNGVLAPVMALIGVYITIRISEISEKRNETAIEKEEMAHRPLLYLYCGDYENHLSIAIQNKGLGVLMLKSYKIVHLSDSSKDVSSFYELVKEFDKHLENYTGDMNSEIIMANEEKELFKAINPWKDNTKTEFKKDHDEFKEMTNKIRKILKDYSIKIEYTDIYGEKQFSYERDLSLYGRELQ